MQVGGSGGRIKAVFPHTSPSVTGPGWRECASESGWPGPIPGRAAKTSVSVPAYSSVFLETSIMQAICL